MHDAAPEVRRSAQAGTQPHKYEMPEKFLTIPAPIRYNSRVSAPLR